MTQSTIKLKNKSVAYFQRYFRDKNNKEDIIIVFNANVNKLKTIQRQATLEGKSKNIIIEVIPEQPFEY